jgi:hypothetical protein
MAYTTCLNFDAGLSRARLRNLSFHDFKWSIRLGDLDKTTSHYLCMIDTLSWLNGFFQLGNPICASIIPKASG